MNKTSNLSARLIGFALACFFAGASESMAARETGGQVIVAGLIGNADARIFDGPIHHGQTRLVPLFKGAVVGETARIITGKDSQIFLVTDSGAQMALDPRTELIIRRVGGISDGLPRNPGEVNRVVDVELVGGRAKFSAPGDGWEGQFIIASPAGSFETPDDETIVECQSRDNVLVTRGNQTVTLADFVAGKAQASALAHASPANGSRSFSMWRSLQRDLKPIQVARVGEQIDRKALGSAVGVGKLTFIGPYAKVLSTSPTDPPPPPPPPPEPDPEPLPPDETFKPGKEEGPAPSSDEPERRPASRWNPIEISRWYEDVGVLKGVTYYPPNVDAPNQMWSADTFDIDLIRNDFKLMKDSGYTDVNAELNIREWLSDPDGFMDRLEAFIELTQEFDLRFTPTLFRLSELQAGGFSDEDIQNFLKAIMNNFTQSKQVVYWDLFNAEELDSLDSKSRALLDKVVEWARQVQPKQPISLDTIFDAEGNAVDQNAFERTDLITFKAYGTPEQVLKQIEELKKFNRPIVCTGFLDRQNGNTFEDILPIFAVNKVGWFNKGLVRPYSKQGEDVWSHYVFDQDGKPYDEKEVELIKEFKFSE